MRAFDSKTYKLCVECSFVMSVALLFLGSTLLLQDSLI